MPLSTANIRVSELNPQVIVLSMDMLNRSANVLTDTLFAELDQIMEVLSHRNDLNGVILTSAKPGIFVAGADLKAIAASLDWPQERIVKFCDQGRAVMARFSRCPFVTVAAIDGACVGGGLELAMWCDCRVATDRRQTQLGLPEVKLGLIPGWGGTARLPRLIGFAAAAEMIVTGELISADSAKKLELVDGVVSLQQLIAASNQIIRRMKTSGAFIHNRRAIMGPVPFGRPPDWETDRTPGDPASAGPDGTDPALSEIESVVRKLGQQIVSSKDVFPFAPTIALEHMARTALESQPVAWESESIAMAEVYGTPAHRGLLNHFFLVDRNKKQPGLVDLGQQATPVKKIGIVGAGLMGRAIAENCLRRNVSVVIFDAVNHSAASVVSDLNSILSSEIPSASDPGKDASRGQRTVQTWNARIEQADSYDDFAGVDLVIESVVETLDVKAGVLKQIETAVSDNVFIASNTSAIPITRLASSLNRADRFCGIHFCHPELMSLVEVVRGADTSESTNATAVKFVRSLGKLAVAMHDGPGFVVNRLLAAMLDQAIRLLTIGFSVEQIDSALRDFGFLGGPFEIIDVVGADTCMYAGRTMWESGLQCVTLSPILPRMVKLQRLGRKSGVGFYRYPDRRGVAVPDESVVPIIESYLARDESRQPPSANRLLSGSRKNESRNSKSAEKIVTQVLSAMVLEATRILEEEIVADFRDIDLCVIHGFGFPKHCGGILFWADRVGLAVVSQTLFEIVKQEPRLEPSEMLKSMQVAGKRFYI